MRAVALGLGALMFLGAGAARGDEDEEAIARRHHARGLSLISQRRFVDALKELEEGYRHQNASSFLFNMGRAAAEQAALENDRDKAVTYRRRAVMEWRAYLRARPDAPERNEIEARLESMDRDIVVYDEERAARRVQEAEAEARAKERAEHRSEVDALRSEVRAMKNQMESERARHQAEAAALRQKVDQLNAKLEATHEREHDVAADLRDELRRAGEKLEAERARAAEEKQKLERTVRELESDKDDLKHTVSELQSEKRTGGRRRLILRSIGTAVGAFGASAAVAGGWKFGGGAALESTLAGSRMFNAPETDRFVEAGSLKATGGALLGVGITSLVMGIILNLLAY